MSTLVVIPARGGSKGIPAKNLQSVGGVPLVVRAVRTALAAGVGDVVVSTDDTGIAAAARAAGARIVERPPEIAGDDASSESVILHTLDVIEGADEPLPEIVVMVQCTSPFVTPAEVNGVVALVESGADSAFTAAATHAFLWRTGDNGAAVGVNHDSRTRLRRQERGQEFEESGAVYAMRTVGFRAARHRFFGRVAIHEVPKAHALEIDDPDDLVMAQVIASGFSDHQRHAALPNPVLAVVFDFDGVLTDNRVLTFADGGEAVSSDRSDGLGLEQLRQEGLPMVVLSKERHPVVAARCAKLGIAVQQGLDDKESVLRAWIDDQGLDPAGVVFVGNDVNDLGCLQAVGCGVVVADAHESVLGAADIVLSRPGGRGSVRELADLILAAKRSMLT